jgi:signal transduction histidine kinase
MKKELSLLLVEDNDGDVKIIKELLKDQTIMAFNITIAGDLADAMEKLSKSIFDIILLDLGLPDSHGYETFSKLIKYYPNANAIIILTGLDDTEVGLNAIYEGAQDYLVKGSIDTDKLIKSIIYSFERNRLNIELKEQLEAKKNAEGALIKSRDKAEESDRLKTAFLHNISHEIRTPMNAIVGFSALLSEPGLSSETRKSFIETIIQSSNNLLAIINDIVEISNIDAMLVKVSKSEVDLNRAVQTVGDIFRLRIKESNKLLNININCPDISVKLLTDSGKLFQVLSNLLNNAMKFSDSGEIGIWYTKREKDIQFSVSDNGIGISKEYYNKIFDRFFQVEYTETRYYEGTGLGLSISKAYVELLGGKIWVNSEIGKGSVFYFTLPLE